MTLGSQKAVNYT